MPKIADYRNKDLIDWGIPHPIHQSRSEKRLVSGTSETSKVSSRFSEIIAQNLEKNNLRCTNMEQEKVEKVKPVEKFSAGKVKGSIWKNIDREGRVFYTSKIVSVYKKGEEWIESDSYGLHDLPDLQLVAQNIYAWLRMSNSLKE